MRRRAASKCHAAKLARVRRSAASSEEMQAQHCQDLPSARCGRACHAHLAPQFRAAQRYDARRDVPPPAQWTSADHCYAAAAQQDKAQLARQAVRAHQKASLYTARHRALAAPRLQRQALPLRPLRLRACDTIRHAPPQIATPLRQDAHAGIAQQRFPRHLQRHPRNIVACDPPQAADTPEVAFRQSRQEEAASMRMFQSRVANLHRVAARRTRARTAPSHKNRPLRAARRMRRVVRRAARVA
mmetsp:Transcript_13302/g.35769  ORF Transcript_13302/g.35769 Transcript_13302/m.35769 type:complete len:243 (-) Transcript_13302:623-1351(-)